MAIKVYQDRIEFNSYTLQTYSDGLTFNGSITATGYDVITQAQGSTSGFASGGNNGFGTWRDLIERFPFSSDSNAASVGTLVSAKDWAAGQSSGTAGYVSGGRFPTGSPAITARIDKFLFASTAAATNIGNLTAGRYAVGGQSSPVSGYSTAGNLGPPSFSNSNTVDKFPFATDAGATSVGTLPLTRWTVTGQSSATAGYMTGFTAPIIKFSFASDATYTNIGNLTVTRASPAGQNSTTHGYTSGGDNTNVIDNFPFATDSGATDVGDLTVARLGAAGQSSTVSGYTAGGSNPGGSTNVIDKFPFATNANATDVGDLTQTKVNLTGNQV